MTRTKPRGRRGTSRGRGHNEGVKPVDIDELRRRIDSGTYGGVTHIDYDPIPVDHDRVNNI